jgi:hypothetical protein
MFYVTGDTHGNQTQWMTSMDKFLKKGDTIIVVGDFGIGFFDGRHWPEDMFFDYLSEKPYTVLFIDGNHENFDKLNSYPVSEWHGGKVHLVRKNIIHLMRGEVYEIDGEKMFVMGGGYSLDKVRRVEGETWWKEELPNDEEYENARKNLEKHNYQVDYVITHTAPINTVEYMIRLGVGPTSPIADEYNLTTFLQWVSDKIFYKKWYFGHFHTDKELLRNQYVVLDTVRDLKTGNAERMRKLNSFG